jgi:hypothetical protein
VVGLVGGALLFASSVRRHRRGLHGFEGELTPTPIPDAPLDTATGTEQIQPPITGTP